MSTSAACFTAGCSSYTNVQPVLGGRGVGAALVFAALLRLPSAPTAAAKSGDCATKRYDNAFANSLKSLNAFGLDTEARL
jgi:hypothetical protein